MRKIVGGTLALALVVLLWQGAHWARAYRFVSREYRPRHAAVPRPPDAGALGLVDVAFRSRDGRAVRGWYVPSRTGAAVVLCHGTESDRSSMLPEARAIAAAGIGVLLFDWPGNGESEGDARFGREAWDALTGALDFLAARPDVAPGRVGALGFSIGSYVVAQVAARDTRIRAVVLEGAYGDASEQAHAEYGRGGAASSWGAVAATHAGTDVRTARPLDVVASISPRPLVIVAGSADVTVPLALSRQLYDAARQPKELWVIDGARHGTYLEADSSYGGRLRAFFSRALGESAASAHVSEERVVRTHSVARRRPRGRRNSVTFQTA